MKLTMTPENLAVAKELEKQIYDLKRALIEFDADNTNHYQLPDEMWKFHMFETRAWMESEKARLEHELAAL